MEEKIDGWVICTEKEAQAVVQLRESLKDIHDQLIYQNLNLENHVLIRFLRFNSMKVQKADAQMREALEWFKSYDPEDVAERYDPPEAIKRFYTGGVLGHDKEGTPIFWDRLGQIDVALVKHVTREEVVKWEVQKTEIITRALEAASTPDRRQYQIVNVMDLRGLGRKHYVKEGMKALEEVLYVADHYYPERLKIMLIVNAPSIFSLIWKVVQYFVSPVSRARVKIVSGDPTKLLFKYIDKAQVPAYLGGDLSINGDPNCCPPILKGGKIPSDFKGAPSAMREANTGHRTSFVLPAHVLEKLRNYSVMNTNPDELPAGTVVTSSGETVKAMEGSFRHSVLSDLLSEEDDVQEEKTFIQESVDATLEWISNISEQLTSQAPDWSLLGWIRGDNADTSDDDDYADGTTPMALTPRTDAVVRPVVVVEQNKGCAGCACTIS